LAAAVRLPSYGALGLLLLEGPFLAPGLFPGDRKAFPSMLLNMLLSLNILVCVALILVVLMQRSEGGALGAGGGPTGLITTRGAGDLLTRTTWVLFALFLSLSLALTLISGRERSNQAILSRLKLQSINPDAVPTPTTPPPITAPIAPVGGPGANPLQLAPQTPAPQTVPVAAPIAAPPLRTTPRPAAAVTTTAPPRAAAPKPARTAAAGAPAATPLVTITPPAVPHVQSAPLAVPPPPTPKPADPDAPVSRPTP
jgi:preprotein translocase subunit SecG